MPASIAHMLIAHKGLKQLQESKDKDEASFAKDLDEKTGKERYQAYMNLGSLGPDLYYFENLAKGLTGMVADGYVSAEGVTPWAYHLHSSKPNEFVLKLIQIVFSDAEREGKKAIFDVDSRRKIAYIAGHLSHIAEDQIIHPLVNKIAGPYYTDGKHRELHREAEVYQDYFLYQEVYSSEDKTTPTYKFFEQGFQNWPDCVVGLKNTEDWFRYFLQRGFIETYGVGPDEDTIENSVDGVLVSLWFAKQMGPYKKADKEYRKQGVNGPRFQEYVGEPKYLEYYGQAVELTKVYMSALYKVYRLLADGKNFDEKRKKRFCEVVSGADLSCPLEEDILEKAKAELAIGI
ncbi:MAG: zinc dependent phospholipase C family protein [Phycisphaerae bacterium]